MWIKSRRIVELYKVPQWAKCLKIQPKERIKLANTPTPIQYWPLTCLPKGVDVFIKREDMTGSTLSGNKVRKLEFLLADAIKKGYTDVITAGRSQSNHIRCTSIAAREVGLQTHCVYTYRENVLDYASMNSGGNFFLTKLAGGTGYFLHIEVNSDAGRKADSLMNKIIDEIREKCGHNCYYIPIGGANALSSFAYIDAYQEMLTQGITDHVTDIVVACGSGSTIASLAVANYLACQDKIRMHGISICLDCDDIYKHTDNLLEELGLADVEAREILHMTNYKGEGYCVSTKEERDFIVEVCKTTGIALDTTYTGKAAYGMVQELKCNPGSFKGNQILFIHSGGVYTNLTTTKLQEFDDSVDWKWKIMQSPGESFHSKSVKVKT